MDVPSLSRRRLLILDDDPLTGQTMKSIAERVGLEVRYTSSPADFFRTVAEWRPTHIALDLVMPEMDGIQVIQQLALLRCQSAIILTSGVGSRVLEAARRLADEHGLTITGVLAKPFTLADLRQLLLEDAPLKTPTKARSVAPRWRPTPSDLRQALADRAIVPFYQPKIVCATGALAGFETLARWQHPQYGVVDPSFFVAIAEDAGLVDDLTLSIAEQALQWFAPLCNPSLSNDYARSAPLVGLNLHLGINISVRSLNNAALFHQISEMCRRFGVTPEHLSFELTESSAMDDPVASLKLLTRLRMQGFHLALDDFGTGFSSMLQLVRLPFSEIKIDKSFVSASSRSQESRTVVRSIVDLGRSLGLFCTAEGVEDLDTLSYLRMIGCDLAQGHVIAPPMSGEAARRWIERHAPSLSGKALPITPDEDSPA